MSDYFSIRISEIQKQFAQENAADVKALGDWQLWKAKYPELVTTLLSLDTKLLDEKISPLLTEGLKLKAARDLAMTRDRWALTEELNALKFGFGKNV